MYIVFRHNQRLGSCFCAVPPHCCRVCRLALSLIKRGRKLLVPSVSFFIASNKTVRRQHHMILCCAGTILSITGCILLAFAESKSFNVFAPALILIGFGGPGHHLSIFHLSNLVPKMKGLVIALAVSTFVNNCHTIS